VVDGNCSVPFSGRSVLLYDRGRIYGPNELLGGSTQVIDAVTGDYLYNTAFSRHPAVDTSGALLWVDEAYILRNGLKASGGFDRGGRALLGVHPVDDVHCFRFGVCVVRNGSLQQDWVLSFDGEPLTGASVVSCVTARARLWVVRVSRFLWLHVLVRLCIWHPIVYLFLNTRLWW
jgi:hypothetical protein